MTTPHRLDPPHHFDDERRRIWADTITALTIRGRIFTADPDLLAAYTEQVITSRRAAQLLAQTDVLIMRDGKASPNPAVDVQRRSAVAIAQLARTLGLDRAPVTVQLPQTAPAPISAARWCDQHGRSECTHHKRRCGHPAGSPVPPEGCCHGQNITGTAACRFHAGKSLAEAKADGQANLARIYTGAPLMVDPAAALLAELGYSAQLTAELRAEVARLAAEPGPDGHPGSGLFWGTTVRRERDGVVEEEQRAGPHVILRALDAERDHLIRTAAAAHTAGAQAAQIDLARTLGAGLFQLLDTIFAGLQLSEYQRDELVPVVVPAAIRAWDQDGAEQPSNGPAV